MADKYVCFFPDGSVEISEHEGPKNKWPVGTITSMIWGNTAAIEKYALGLPRKKVSPIEWRGTSYTQITPEHKAMLFLMGFDMSFFDS